MLTDRYLSARMAHARMCLYVLLFFGLCFSAHGSTDRSYQHGPNWYRPRRFAEIGGQRFDRSQEMYWHVGIYSKSFSPYMQICGGTLVTPKAVISAAHCFWSDAEGALPANYFAVGAGKQFRPWDENNDSYTSQTSDVAEIHIPDRYHDFATNYQEDIAVVIVAEKFSINEHAVRPACVNFDEAFDDEQLTPENKGTILGWGLTDEDGPPSQVLNYLKLPVVGIKECMSGVDPGFLRYLTSDKICAGVTTGKALCRGDSGGGLVFKDRVGAIMIPYLRAVASTAPRNEHRCNAHALAALTHVRAHRAFLRRHVPDIEAQCEEYYPLAYTLRVRERPGYTRDRYTEPTLATTEANPTDRSTTVRRYMSSLCSCE